MGVLSQTDLNLYQQRISSACQPILRPCHPIWGLPLHPTHQSEAPMTSAFRDLVPGAYLLFSTYGTMADVEMMDAPALKEMWQEATERQPGTIGGSSMTGRLHTYTPFI